MKTESLTAWEIEALTAAVTTMVQIGTLNSADGHQLKDKLIKASKIRLFYDMVPYQSN